MPPPLALARFGACASCALALAFVRGEARAAEPADKGDHKDEPHTEIAGVPVIGGSSDIGLGFGLVGAMVRYDPKVLTVPDRDPRAPQYLWRAEVGSFTTFRSGVIPFSDHYLKLTIPNLPGGLRIDVRPSFTVQSTLLYSGLGNDSPPPKLVGGSEQDRYQYGRTYPSMVARGRAPLPWDGFYLQLGVGYTENWFDIPADGVLAMQTRDGPPIVRQSLVGQEQHGVLLTEYGVVYDSRDNEIATTSGQFHEFRLRVSPKIGDHVPFAYEQAEIVLRGYVTPIKKRLTLAGRLVGDVMLGNVPFYELSRFDETYAIGGIAGVRGVIAQRYYGKVKIFGNFEARSDVFDFHLLKRDMTLGVVGFFDAGRLWLDLGDNPELDGTGLGIHWGAGGGLRLKIGEALVLRADVAYSPDGRPISGYFQANHLF